MQMITIVVIGLLGFVVLIVGSLISLMVLRTVIRYHLEDEGVRVTFLSFTLWYTRWREIRSVRLVSGWQALCPRMTVMLGNNLLGPGVEIKGKWLGAIITPSDPERFLQEVRKRAMLH
jgi:hypothetical protein